MVESRPVTFVVTAGAYPHSDLCEAIETLREFFIDEFRAVDIIRNKCMIFAEFNYKVVSIGTKGFITVLGFDKELMIMLTIIDPAYPFMNQATMLGQLHKIIKDILLKAIKESGIAEEKEVFIVDARYFDYPFRLVDAYHVGIRNMIEDYLMNWYAR